MKRSHASENIASKAKPDANRFMILKLRIFTISSWIFYDSFRPFRIFSK